MLTKRKNKFVQIFLFRSHEVVLSSRKVEKKDCENLIHTHTGKVNGGDEVFHVQIIAYCCSIEDERKKKFCELVLLLSVCTGTHYNVVFMCQNGSDSFVGFCIWIPAPTIDMLFNSFFSLFGSRSSVWQTKRIEYIHQKRVPCIASVVLVFFLKEISRKCVQAKCYICKWP